jgi:hypothetical protein
MASLWGVNGYRKGGEMRSHPEIGIWELVSETPCFGPHLILCGQNPLTAWYLGPDTSSLTVRPAISKYNLSSIT